MLTLFWRFLQNQWADFIDTLWKGHILSRLYAFFFNSVLRPFEDYFTNIEVSQSVGAAKMGVPRRKTTWHTGKQKVACPTCDPCGA